MTFTYQNSLGWRRSYASPDDFYPGSNETTARLQALGEPPVADLLQKLGIVPTAEAGERADLSGYFSPIEDQGSIGSCTAHATIALAEYYQRRAFGVYSNLSRLFLYKATRNFLGWTGDTGAFMRTALGALALFGAPPEDFWPYIPSKYDKEPPAFVYSLAQNFQALQYFRLDEPGLMRPDLVDRIRAFIANGLPVMAGWTVFASVNQSEGFGKGEIPYPAPREKIIGGHGFVLCGYDDNKVITNRAKGSQPTIGAFRVHNSWGRDWGDEGYGWLPYSYFLAGLADDVWTIIKSEWVYSGQFDFQSS
jgi:C1A family cysteine protease